MWRGPGTPSAHHGMGGAPALLIMGQRDLCSVTGCGNPALPPPAMSGDGAVGRLLGPAASSRTLATTLHPDPLEGAQEKVGVEPGAGGAHSPELSPSRQVLLSPSPGRGPEIPACQPGQGQGSVPGPCLYPCQGEAGTVLGRARGLAQPLARASDSRPAYAVTPARQSRRGGAWPVTQSPGGPGPADTCFPAPGRAAELTAGRLPAHTPPSRDQPWCVLQSCVCAFHPPVLACATVMCV